MTEQRVSVTRACRIIALDRSMYYYESVKDDGEVEEKLREYASVPRLSNRGCPEYYKRIRREGLKWNHKRVERVYKKLGMNRKKKHKKRITNPEKQPLVQPLEKNLVWSMDFMEDRLENGRKVRTLNVMDDYNREILSLDIEHSFPSERVVQTIDRIIEWRGKPESIRTDNGTEFLAKAFKGFCRNSGINHIRIQKGKPSQNGFIERFNRSYREGVLDAYIFESLDQIREQTHDWVEDYNNEHPHDSLGGKTPIEFLTSRTKNNSIFKP